MTFLQWLDESLMLNRALHNLRNLHPPWDHFGYSLGHGTFGEDRGLATGCRQQAYVTKDSAEAVIQALKSRYIQIASDKRIEE